MPEIDTHALGSNCGVLEQARMVHSLKGEGHELQCFEFAPFKMLNMFMHPARVHEFRGSVTLGTRLIQWAKNPPLLVSTKNLRFLYVDDTDNNNMGTVCNA